MPHPLINRTVITTLAFATTANAITIDLTFDSAASDAPSFDPTGTKITAIMNAAADVWEDILEDSLTLDITFWYDNLSSTTLAVSDPVTVVGDFEVEATIRFDTTSGGSERLWFFDTTPESDNEYDMAQILYQDLDASEQSAFYTTTAPDLIEAGYRGAAVSSAPTAAKDGFDALSVALHEIGHSLGVPASNTSSTETIDGDYDSPSNFFGGTSVGIDATGVHISNELTLMYPFTDPGFRTRPSATDLAAMASANPWTTIDLRRQDFLSGTTWHSIVNWEGTKIPDLNDDVHIRHGGTVTVTTNASVNSLTIDNTSSVRVTGGSSGFGNLDIQSGTLEVLAVASGTSVNVEPGGLIDMQGGTFLSADDITLNHGGFLSAAILGYGTIGSATKINNNGAIVADGGELIIAGGLFGGGSIDLDGTSANGSVTVAGSTDTLTILVPVTDAFDTTMTIDNRGTVDFDANPWTLAAAGTLNLSDGARLDGTNTFTVFGDIDVTEPALSSINAPIDLRPGATLTVANSANLAFTGPTTFNGALITGGGFISQRATLHVNGSTTLNVHLFDLDGNTGATNVTVNEIFTIDVERLDVANDIFDGTITINPFGQMNVTVGDGTWDMNGTLNLNGPSAGPATFITGSDMNINGTVNADGKPKITAKSNTTGTINTADAATIYALGPANHSMAALATFNGPGLLQGETGTRLTGSGTINTNIDFNGDASLIATGLLNITGLIFDAGLIGSNLPAGILNISNTWNTATTTELRLEGGSVTGAAITNDGKTTGYGMINAPFINNKNIIPDAGIITFFDGSTLDLDGTTNNGGLDLTDGSVTINGAFPNEFTFKGSIGIDSPHVLMIANGGIRNQGVIKLNGGTMDMANFVQDANLIVNAASTIRTTDPTTHFDNGSTTFMNHNLTLDGNFRVVTGANITGIGTLIVAPGASLSPENATFNAPIANNGTTTVAVTTETFNKPFINNDSLTAVKSTLHFNDGLINHADLNLTRTTVTGPITSPAGSDVTITDFATFNSQFSGAAQFPGTGQARFAARYEPGDSFAHIKFSGPVQLSNTTTVQIELQAPTPIIASPNPGTDYDSLLINDAVTLDGTLELDFQGAAHPNLATIYNIMSFTNRGSSMYDTITGTLLSTNLALAPLFTSTDDALNIRATVPGDLNLDNKVSVADLSIFALNFNTNPGLYDETLNLNSWELGDFNTDGQITVADLSLLALNFGFQLLPDGTATAPIGLSTSDVATLAGIDLSTIPEPTSSATFMLLIGFITLKRPQQPDLINLKNHAQPPSSTDMSD